MKAFVDNNPFGLIISPTGLEESLSGLYESPFELKECPFGLEKSHAGLNERFFLKAKDTSCSVKNVLWKPKL